MSNFFTKYKHLYLWLFPIVFYLVHLGTYAKYIDLVQLIPGVIAIYVVILIVYYFINRLNFVHRETTLATFFMALFFYFFYGNIQLGIADISFLKAYKSVKFLLPFFLVFLILFYKYNKKNNRFLNSMLHYYNVLVIVIGLMQVGIIFSNYFKDSKKPKVLSELQLEQKVCDFNNNIYLIMMDEYAGNISLHNHFKYNNANFTNQFRSKGFMVRDSSNSNYNMTVASMGSMLNMQYINHEQLKPYNNYQSVYLGCYKIIKQNYLFQFLQKQNYSIVNNSVFEINGSNKHSNVVLGMKAINQIHSDLFHNKMYEILHHFLGFSNYKNRWYNNKYVRLPIHNYNETIYQKTLEFSKLKKNKTLLYTHFMMPHGPYYLDSNSNLMTGEETKGFNGDSLYLGNLIGCSKKMARLTDSILKYDSKAIIILFSDHGYKSYLKPRSHFLFNNFFAVKLPDSNYTTFKNMHTNVNVFRVILNQYFHQNLPNLADSSFIYDLKNNTFDHFNFAPQLQ